MKILIKINMFSRQTQANSYHRRSQIEVYLPRPIPVTSIEFYHIFLVPGTFLNNHYVIVPRGIVLTYSIIQSQVKEFVKLEQMKQDGRGHEITSFRRKKITWSRHNSIHVPYLLNKYLHMFLTFNFF